MSPATQFLASSRGRALVGIFALLLVMLSYFSLSAASGVGGAGIYLATAVQMLTLAAVVAPYVYAVVFLDEGEPAT